MKRAPTKRRWRFRGICADAAALGVRRESLYKVLVGNRPGKSLTERYHALKAAQASQQTQPYAGPMALKQQTTNAGPADSSNE